MPGSYSLDGTMLKPRFTVVFLMLSKDCQKIEEEWKYRNLPYSVSMTRVRIRVRIPVLRTYIFVQILPSS